VTLSRFDHRTNDIKESSGLGLIILSPIIAQSRLAAWEQYAYSHQDFIYTDWLFHAGEPLYAQNPGNITPSVYSYQKALDVVSHDPTWKDVVVVGESAADDLGPPSPRISEPFHLPVWQTGPVPHNATIVNFDLYTHPAFKSVIDNSLEVNHMLLSGLADLQLVKHFTSHGDESYDTPQSFRK
jgi:hypothetical protein